MRDHFLDQLGGAHFAREDSEDDGETKASTDQSIRSRFFAKQGDQVVGDRQGRDRTDTNGLVDESRHPGVARLKAWPWLVAGVGLAVAALTWIGFSYHQGGRATSTVPLPQVTVSKPLVRDVDTRIGLLGQFSAINRVELRAQVGGTLTEIHFQDGQIVNKGDLLFVIDPRPYEIKLARANALLADRDLRASRSPPASLAARSRSSAAVSQPPRQSTSARPSRTLHRPRSTTPRHRFATLSSISNIPASPRRSPAVSARVWSRSAVSLPAAVLAAARQPC